MFATERKYDLPKPHSTGRVNDQWVRHKLWWSLFALLTTITFQIWDIQRSWAHPEHSAVSHSFRAAILPPALPCHNTTCPHLSWWFSGRCAHFPPWWRIWSRCSLLLWGARRKREGDDMKFCVRSRLGISQTLQETKNKVLVWLTHRGEEKNQAGKVVWRIKTLIAKPDDLGSILRIHTVEDSCGLFSDTQARVHACTHTLWGGNKLSVQRWDMTLRYKSTCHIIDVWRLRFFTSSPSV